jgi:hypothetical protein
MVVASRPANGSATANGYIVTYRSRPGFLGHDSFVFLIKGSTSDGPYTSTVQVELDVKEHL